MMGLPIIIVALYASGSLNSFYLTITKDDLTSRAYIIASQVEDHIAHSPARNIDSVCKALAGQVKTRFTVIAPSGRVLGDSRRNPDSMENHASRPEVIAALSGKVGTSDRFSQTLQEDMIYAAIPVYASGSIVAVVRTAVAKTVFEGAIAHLYTRVAWAFLFTAFLAALISLLVSGKVSRPINAMKIGAQRFASGDFSKRVSPSGCEETLQLAEALNEMARKLSETISQITSQRNELNAIMSSMTEGVIAVDVQEKILSINQSAAALFNIDKPSAAGKWIGEAVRNADLFNFLNSTLQAKQPAEAQIEVLSPTSSLKGDGERFLQLHGSPLLNPTREVIGAVVVINDVTRLQKLDNIRKDFVANVSHELRTPLTSIKGFVETLLSGAVHNPDEAQRFLNILSNQAQRLSTIVEDLLALSKIEREAEQNVVELSEGDISSVLEAAIDACSMKSSGKNITIERRYLPGLSAPINGTLLEQAIVNLLDNAINYSEPNKRIIVSEDLSPDKSEIIISVRDEGIGIAREHLDRLFERFYRVDKARSRSVGGTGLGLSIVKHIVLAHGGRVDVDSKPGEGSVFFIYLPRNSFPLKS